MDAIDVLIGDHNRVRGLFAQFEEAKEANAQQVMEKIAELILAELEAHTTIEEEIFYPAVRSESGEIGDTVDEGLQEHHIAKVLLSEIKALDPRDEQWTPKFTVLIESVEHHAGEEESDLFPKVRTQTTTRRLNDLGEQLESRKAQLGAPTSADAVGLGKDQLIDLARDQEIPGRSTMNREELASTVDAREAQVD